MNYGLVLYMQATGDRPGFYRVWGRAYRRLPWWQQLYYTMKALVFGRI